MRFLFVIIFLSIGFVEASENEKIALEAEAFYSLGKYDLACEAFERLLERVESPSQKSLVRYNLGNSWMARGEWRKALHEFSKISPDDLDSPMLGRGVTTNIAYALWKQSESWIELEDWSSLERGLKEGLESLGIATQAEDRAAQFEGRKTEKEDLILLEKHLKELLNRARKEKKQQSAQNRAHSQERLTSSDPQKQKKELLHRVQEIYFEDAKPPKLSQIPKNGGHLW